MKHCTVYLFKVHYFGSVKPAANTRARQYCSKLHSVVLVRPRTSFHSAAAGRQKGETASLEIWQADALIRFTAPTTLHCTSLHYFTLHCTLQSRNTMKNLIRLTAAHCTTVIKECSRMDS